MLKVVFVFAERWISDQDAGSIAIVYKHSTFKNLFTTEIPEDNDTSRDPEYGLGTMGPESINTESISALGTVNGYRDVSVPAGTSIVNIFSNSQNLSMK
jgi:hypothetical protein